MYALIYKENKKTLKNIEYRNPFLKNRALLIFVFYVPKNLNNYRCPIFMQ